MRAMVFARYGGPETLTLAEVEKPVPGPGELLVRVHATSVNPVDWKLHSGLFRFIVPGPRPRMHGFDVAGVVAEVGPSVPSEKVGRAVWAMIGTRSAGAGAEYTLVRDDWAALKPERLSFEEAAAVPLAGLTALQGLRDQAHLAAGEDLLVNGASGGVGLFALQLGKALGARVTAVASSRNSDLLREYGADRVVAYDRERIEGRFNVIFDAVATLSVWSARRLLAPSGRFVSTLPNLAFVANRLARPLLTLAGAPPSAYTTMVRSDRRDLEHLGELVASGKLRVHLDKVFPLEELAAAHAYSRSGRVRGKIVVTVGAERGRIRGGSA